MGGGPSMKSADPLPDNKDAASENEDEEDDDGLPFEME